MKYFVFEDRECAPDWRVEGMDEQGQVYITIFSGPDAEKRAQEYYAIKTGKLVLNSQSTAPAAAAPSFSAPSLNEVTVTVQNGRKIRLYIPGLTWTWDAKRKTIMGRQSAIQMVEEDLSATSGS